MPTLLSNALLNRGVLLEICNQDIYLTDNIYAGPPLHAPNLDDWHQQQQPDNLTVSTLLKRLSLDSGLIKLPHAQLDETQSGRNPHLVFRLDQADCDLSQEQLHLLFNQPHHREEAKGPPVWRGNGIRQFKKHLYSPKIPLAVLDPYIAILVKGLSAVGCYSWCSCQGHSAPRRPLRIDFIDQINGDWAQHLLNKAQSSGLMLFDLSVDEKLLIETKGSLEDPERDMQKLWQQAILFGRFLYDNRLALREERQSWADVYSPKPG